MLESMLAFLKEQWYIALLTIVVLFIVIKVIKSVIKWIIFIVIIAAVLIYGANYTSII